MCDVCEAEGRDWSFSNGTKKSLRAVKLYRVYVGQLAKITVCHLHSIELFCVGEQRFLENHHLLAVELSVNKKRFTTTSYLGF